MNAVLQVGVKDPYDLSLRTCYVTSIVDIPYQVNHYRRLMLSIIFYNILRITSVRHHLLHLAEPWIDSQQR